MDRRVVAGWETASMLIQERAKRIAGLGEAARDRDDMRHAELDSRTRFEMIERERRSGAPGGAGETQPDAVGPDLRRQCGELQLFLIELEDAQGVLLVQPRPAFRKPAGRWDVAEARGTGGQDGYAQLLPTTPQELVQAEVLVHALGVRRSVAQRNRHDPSPGQLGKHLPDGIRHWPSHAEGDLVERDGRVAAVVQRDALLQHRPLGRCREPMAYVEAGQLAGDRQGVPDQAERRSFEGFMDTGAGFGGAHGAIEIWRIGDIEAGGAIVKSDVDLSAVEPSCEAKAVVGYFDGRRVSHAHRIRDRTHATWRGPVRDKSVEVREYASLGGGPAPHPGCRLPKCKRQASRRPRRWKAVTPTLGGRRRFDSSS